MMDRRYLAALALLLMSACGAPPTGPSTSPTQTESPSPTTPSECAGGVTVLGEYDTPDGHIIEVCGQCSAGHALTQGYGHEAGAGTIEATVSMAWSSGDGPVGAELRLPKNVVVDSGELASDGTVELQHTLTEPDNVTIGLVCPDDGSVVDWWAILQVP